MKLIAAYLLAVLGGNTSPSADDIKNILESGISVVLHISILSLLWKFSQSA
jgi:ribosomal protein L12E/L44/L45/RPP1/RPP2